MASDTASTVGTNGQLSEHALFQISVNLSKGFQVPVAADATNTSIGDLLDDIRTALSVASDPDTGETMDLIEWIDVRYVSGEFQVLL